MPYYEFEDKRPTVDSEAWVHPLAVLIGDVKIERGCYIGAGAVLRGDIGSIRIGRGSNVQENCVLHSFPDKSVILHPDSHVGHGAILHGCEICSYALVGMGAIIGDDVKINSYCLIGAGAVVTAGTEIPENSLVVGNPGRVLKTITTEQMEIMTYGRKIYQELAARYLKAFREIEPRA
ncbi:MAG: gamma carbonic anhydrase family protein [Desulfomonilaceae bacterium]|nr:gamma carbonic anhydrase family protein [Desulfomonilaceae bacterium]